MSPLANDDKNLYDRVPPQNIQAEQSALGAMLLDREAIDKVVDKLEAADFYHENHRYLFTAIKDLFDRGEPVDLVTVTEMLRNAGKLDSVGGASYISHLANTVPTPANASNYANIVKAKSVMRSLVKAGMDITGIGFTESLGVEESLDKAEQMVLSLAKRQRTGDIKDMRTVMDATYQQIEKIYGEKGRLTGLETGFIKMDDFLSGFQNSELIIIAARPSVGKTALALNIAENVAVDGGKPVFICSLEMAAEQLAQRMISARAEIDGQKLRKGLLMEGDWYKLSDTVGLLSRAPIFIDDTSNMTTLDIRARARRLKAENKLSLIIIDYLQLISGRGRIENRQQEVAEITRDLKSIAREMEVPVLCLAQLSRSVESSADKLPRLSHLKESGEIEQTADVVMFIHREDDANVLKKDPSKARIVKIIIAKQRNGPIGEFNLFWKKEYTKYENLAEGPVES